MYFYFGKIAATPPNAGVLADARPRFARIVGAKNAAFLGCVHGGIEPIGVAGRNAKTDSTQALRVGGQAAREFFPDRAAVHRFVEAAAWALPSPVFPRPLAGCPQVGIDYVGVLGVNGYLNGPRVFVFIKHLFPRFAAVAAAIHAAFFVGAVRVSQYCRKNSVFVGGVNGQAANLLSVAQSQVRPSFARVG